jgi:predicted DNA binding protein
MTLFDVKFKLSFNDEYVMLTRKFPSLKVFFWCNNVYDVFEFFIDDPKDYQTIKEELPDSTSIIEEAPDENRFRLLIKNCSCYSDNSSVDNIVGDLNVLLLSPVIMENGWEEHHAIVFDHKDFEELIGRFEEKGHVVKVVRKVRFGGTISTLNPFTRSALFSSLTEKQADALLTAYNSGYYRLPRKADVKAIAAKHNVPRTTFQDHLRKAECKVISTLIPQIKHFSQTIIRKHE